MARKIGLGFGLNRRQASGGGGGGDTTPPEITNLLAFSNSITGELSEPATVYMLRNTSATLLSGAAIKAGEDTASGSPWAATTEGLNEFSIDDSGWSDGTYYLHFAGEDASANITPLGPVVEWIKTTPFTVYSHVLNPAAATSGLRYTFTANTIFNIATSKSAGYWLGGYAYFDGTDWTGDVISAANSASATGYMALSGNAMIWRPQGGSDLTTTAFSTPGASGWYFVTGWVFLSEAADPDPNRRQRFWRNGTASSEVTSVTPNESGLIAMDRFGFGHRADSTATEYNNFPTCGLCWGTGNPGDMHTWVYNSGTLRDVRDYNFAGDANGCTLGGFWPAGRNSAAAFSVSDTQLDDFVDAIDTPTLVGTMEWLELDAPIGD